MLLAVTRWYGSKDLAAGALEGLGAGSSEAQEGKPVLDQLRESLSDAIYTWRSRDSRHSQAWLLNVRAQRQLSGQPRTPSQKHFTHFPGRGVVAAVQDRFLSGIVHGRANVRETQADGCLQYLLIRLRAPLPQQAA